MTTKLIKQTSTAILMDALFHGARDDVFMAIVEELDERIDVNHEVQKYIGKVYGLADEEREKLYLKAHERWETLRGEANKFRDDVSYAVKKLKKAA